MSPNEPSAVSEESKTLLGEVKKGRKRKFVMIYKGTEIISLVLYKKGTVEGRKKEAKEAGTGQVCYGVVEGKDQDIRFVISRADGFDKSPVKSLVLKSFLADHADVKCKPLFEVVDATPLVIDADDPLAAQFLKLQEATQQACDAHPDRAKEINDACLRIGRLLDEGQAEEAQSGLTALEKLLQSLQGGKPAETATDAPAAEPKPPSQPGEAEARAAKLADALKKLKPLVDKIVDARPEKRDELYAAMAQVAGQIKAQAFDAAREQIVALGATLQKLMAAPSEPTTADPQAEAFQRRLDELEPQLHAAQRAAPDSAVALGNVWAYANDQATAGNLSNATKALDRLTDAIRKALEAPPQPTVAKGTVHVAKTMLTTWKDALAEARGEISKLSDALQPYVPGNVVGTVLAGAEKKLEAFADDLDQALFGAASADDDGGPIERARSMIQAYRGRLSSDRLIQQFNRAKSELGVEIKVESILLAAIEKLDSALAG